MKFSSREFVNAVAEMRQAQQVYFLTRSRDALRYAKSLESKVDKMLRDVAGQSEGVLFDKESCDGESSAG